MNRKQQIAAGAAAVDQLATEYAARRTEQVPDGTGCAAAVLDAVYPLVSSVDEVWALDEECVLMDSHGFCYRIYSYPHLEVFWREALEHGPLTVVWRPAPGS